MLNFVKWSSILSDWSCYRRDVHGCSCPCPILIEWRWNGRGRQLIKRGTVLWDLHALSRKRVKKMGSACFCLFVFLFPCSNGVCGSSLNETVLLAFDIASDITKNSCNKRQLANFMVIRNFNLTVRSLPWVRFMLDWHEARKPSLFSRCLSRSAREGPANKFGPQI